MSNFFESISVQFLLVLGIGITLAACGVGGDNPPLASGNRTVAVNSSPYDGYQCSTGGIAIETGVDENGNGVLDADEVGNARIVCNGEDGVNTLVSTSDESVGNNCASGGIKIESGADDDGDEILAPEEVDDTDYVCGGEDGHDGIDGADGNDGEEERGSEGGNDGSDGPTSLISIGSVTA